jgi:hypothetical protein
MTTKEKANTDSSKCMFAVATLMKAQLLSEATRSMKSLLNYEHLGEISKKIDHNLSDRSHVLFHFPIIKLYNS